jgi:hypothetical protein
MLRPEHLLASHHLPDFLEQEERAWQGQGLGTLGSGWGREEAASWHVLPSSPVGGTPQTAQQVCFS